MLQTTPLNGPGSIELARSSAPVVKADALLFVHFERPDLKKAERYLLDFGLVVANQTDTDLFMRGTGPQPYIYRITRGPKARFLGLGFSVPAEADLQKLSKAFSRPVERSPNPGGGLVVRLTDPDGVAVDVLYGFVPNEPLPLRPAIPHNAPNQIVRVNGTQRPALEPPQVTKLGHLVLETPDFDRAARWYIDTLGFIPSDVMCLPDGTPVGSFMRLDRGAEPADHHTLFVTMGLESKVDHVAFEVIDLDAVEIGQQIMMANRYRRAWGVGRHLLGSQIFDYWRDPWGQKHE
ncbi:MAG: VOC family protein, partial [Acetobacteraceae bacterium]|nr:VOC family protein [Acetobacteraceae bacterium]